MAEAVSAFRAAGARLLDARPSQAGLLVTKLMSGQEGDLQASGAADLQLKDNVVEFDDELFWVTKCEVSSAQVPGGTKYTAELEGFSASGRELRYPADFPSHSDLILKLRAHIFAGDYMNRYRCARELLNGVGLTDPQLEKAVLRPWRQVPGTYTRPGALREDLMPINSDQRSAVHGLSSRLEVIHGPPGTGKSTTIFHMLSSRLPSMDAAATAAIVTCVTNQAIDAVVEKLAQTHDAAGGLRILVLGNPDRVGRTAGQYTLENLCKRDELVLSMQWATGVLSKTSKAVAELQTARRDRLWRPHRRSRLHISQIERLPSVLRYRVELEAENRQRRYNREAPRVYDPLDFYLRRLDDIKQKLAAAVTQLRPVRFLRRRRFGVPSPSRFYEWNVHSFNLRIQKAYERSKEALSLAQNTAAARNVRRTRVLLCTIPSCYKVMQLQEDYEDDFPKRLFMGILDEAAATAETYIPLILRLQVENLVLLGDHKQLSPLVLASGGDREIKDKNVDRSLMERAIDNNLRPHSLRVQYRMPEVLCNLVSSLFYGGSLRTERSVADRLSRLSLEGQPRQPELRWFNVTVQELDVGTSKVNHAEVVQVIELLRSDPVLGRTLDPVMVITLYKPQAALLQEALAKSLEPRRMAFIKVVTVDAAQGSEAPHIVLSTVRSNSARSIGFAHNPRRLNVAISRAQKTLTIVGNKDVFNTSQPNWNRVVSTFCRQGQASDVSVHALQHAASWHFVQQRALEMMERSASKGKGKGKGKGGKGKGLDARPRDLGDHWSHRGRCRYAPDLRYY
ncbi:Upf1 [Symbiodinium microadriaticum]|nr:Upf1 [Symbiodinium microadriaticum]